MQLESQALSVIGDRTRSAFEAAIDATVEDARQRAAKHRRTGAWMDSIQRTEVEESGIVLTARIGSRLASWRTHELGAFIQARRKPALKFVVNGRWVTVPAPDGVRIAAQPAIVPAVQRTFRISFRDAMASSGLRSRRYGRGSRIARPDFRRGRYRVGR